MAPVNGTFLRFINSLVDIYSLFQDLIKLICDVKSMEEAVIEMKYDAKKAPLGKHLQHVQSVTWTVVIRSNRFSNKLSCILKLKKMFAVRISLLPNLYLCV